MNGKERGSRTGRDWTGWLAKGLCINTVDDNFENVQIEPAEASLAHDVALSYTQARLRPSC